MRGHSDAQNNVKMQYLHFCSCLCSLRESIWTSKTLQASALKTGSMETVIFYSFMHYTFQIEIMKRLWNSKKRLVLSFLGDLCVLWCPWNPGTRSSYTSKPFPIREKSSQAPPWRCLIKVDFVLCFSLCSICWFWYSCVIDKIYKELGKWKRRKKIWHG